MKAQPFGDIIAQISHFLVLLQQKLYLTMNFEGEFQGVADDN